MLTAIKNYLPHAPRCVGNVLAAIPYTMRLRYGRDYRHAMESIASFEHLSLDKKKAFIFERVYRVVAYALENIPFYQQYYSEHRFSLRRLKGFEDISEIPVITKSILQGYALEERCSPKKGRIVSYTGGSTGEPFKFFSDPRQIGNEWAHIHHIWEKIGFHQGNLLLSVALEAQEEPVYYDALRHALVLNIHYPRETIISHFKAIPLRKRAVKYFRGYPSAWAEILSYMENNSPETLEELRATLNGSLLASEFPLPIFRSTIELLTERPTISWFGHSERALLAWEKTRPFLYEPMQSYGYCETITENGLTSLVGTSYYNHVFPFIRYKTDDNVKIVDSQGLLLNAFEVLEGRTGDFLIDKNGESFSITHLNLSCRESTWAIVRSVQVEQKIPGKITLWVTPRGSVSIKQLRDAFQFDSLNLECDFKIIERPIRSSRGKVLLKIPVQS